MSLDQMLFVGILAAVLSVIAFLASTTRGGFLAWIVWVFVDPFRVRDLEALARSDAADPEAILRKMHEDKRDRVSTVVKALGSTAAALLAPVIVAALKHEIKVPAAAVEVTIGSALALAAIAAMLLRQMRVLDRDYLRSVILLGFFKQGVI